jgi:hypothetical protein
MSELILKYHLLNDLGKQELFDFLNFLLSKKNTSNQIEKTEMIYPEKTIGSLLAVLGDYTNEELANDIEDAQKNWKNWTIETW